MSTDTKARLICGLVAVLGVLLVLFAIFSEANFIVRFLSGFFGSCIFVVGLVGAIDDEQW